MKEKEVFQMDESEKKPLGSVDAKDWADEFVKIVGEKPEIATDKGTMAGWFANAIMVGYDFGKKAEKECGEKAAHDERHRQLHRGLDELAADFIKDTGKTPSGATIMELMEWSNGQQKG